MATLFGKILIDLENCWTNIRLFAFRNRTVFEFIFILIYACEQIVLVLLTYLFPQLIMLTITTFAIIVLTTFAVHKLIMESRIKLLESQVIELETLNKDIMKNAEDVNSRLNMITESYRKVINK